MVRNTIQRIRAHLREPGITKKGLAERAGLHPNTLQGVEDERWNPSAATLIALEHQLPSVAEAKLDHDATDTVPAGVASSNMSRQIIGQVPA